MKRAFNFVCLVIAQCVVLSAAWQCEEVRYTSDCVAFNVSNWFEGNCYCSEKEVNGIQTLCCNFQGKPAYLSTNAKEFPYEVITLTNASYLNFFVPRRVVKLQLEDISGGLIPLDYLPESLISKLSIKKSTMDIIEPFYRTVLRDCNIKLIKGGSRTIKRLTLRNTKVEKFRGIFIYSKDKDVRFAMSNSSITTMENFHLLCPTVFESSKIRRIFKSVFAETTFIGMSIDTIYSRGLTLTDGINVFKDTIIIHAHREAIIQHEWVDVKLQSVHIETCEYPCFRIHETTRIILTDFYSNGIREDDPEKLYVSFKRKVEIPSRKLCLRNAVLVCDLRYNQALECLVKKTDFPAVVVKSLSPIEVIEGCFNSLHLDHILGLYHAFLPVYGSNNRKCRKKRFLKLSDVKMSTVYSKDVNLIQIKFSDVYHLDLGIVTRMLVQRSRIYIVDNLVFSPRKTKNHSFVWSSVTIYTIREMVLRSGARIDLLTVENEITKLVVEHHDERTVVQHSSIHSLPYRSIILTSGELYLNDVKIDSASAGAIYIEDGILMIETTGDNRIDCSNGPAISVVERFRVVYIGSNTPDWLWDCTEIRESAPFYEGAIRVEQCREVAQFELYCDMEHIPSEGQWGYLLGNTNALDAYKVVTVVNAADVTVARHCFDKISLINTTVSAMHSEHEHTCCYEIFLQNTTIPEIVFNLMAITILESNVTEWISARIPLYTLNINDSVVKSLLVEVSDGAIINSFVKRVVKLNVTEEMIVHNCTIGAVESFGIISYTNGSLRIIATTFEELVFESVIVHGILEIYNVSLPVAQSGSISILSEGKIELTNVNFPHYTVISVQSQNSSVMYQNVTVADKKVLWNGTQFVYEDFQSSENVGNGHGFIHSIGKNYGHVLATSSAETNLNPALTEFML